MTGEALTGSSTPPIWLAADIWQRAPTCAQLPTSACESIIVPSSMYAPALMYMGGMQVTPRARYAPLRTLDPPGTMRTASCGPNFFSGYVALSRKEKSPTGISTMAPMRKPSRIPFFTHALTRQPVGEAASGWAARTRPALRAARKSSKRRKSSGAYCAGGLSNSRSISACNGHLPEQSGRFQHLLDPREIGRRRRAHRQTVDRLQQAHERQRRLDRDGIRFHEVDVHQRQVFRLDTARGFEIAAQAGARQFRHLRGDLVRGHRDHAAAAEGHERDRDGIVAGKDREPRRHFVQHVGHLRDVTGGFFDADDVFDLRQAHERRRLHVDAGAPLHAIDNDWQRHSSRDGAVVLEKTLLRGLVVVGRHGEDTVHADALQLARELDDLVRVVAARASQHRHAAARLLDRDFNDAKVLRAGESGAFARRAARHQKIDAGIDLPPHEAAESLFIQREVAAKRRDQRGAASRKVNAHKTPSSQ